MTAFKWCRLERSEKKTPEYGHQSQERNAWEAGAAAADGRKEGIRGIAILHYEDEEKRKRVPLKITR